MSKRPTHRRFGEFAGLGFLLALIAFPVFAQDVTVETSAEEYSFGAPVIIVLTNHTDEGITLPYIPPYDIYDGESGETLGIGHYMMNEYLAPHEAAEYSWDQTDGGGSQVPPGPYDVVIYYRTGDEDPWIPVSDSFVILDPEVSGVPDDPNRVHESTWGRIKSGYR